MELTKKYLINGPNNIIRLSDGHKILYIFSDFHHPTNYQTECPILDNYDSIDIDKILFKFMKLEKEREFDLFIEMFDHLDPSYNTLKKERYIDNVNKLFNSRIHFKDKKIYTLKPYSNFRFHYFDIRNLLYLEKELWNYFIDAAIFPFNLVELNYMITYQTELNIKLLELLDYYKNSNDNVIVKIKQKYFNNNIKKKINLIYDEIIINNIINTIKLNKNFIKLLEVSIKELPIDINEIYMKIQSNLYLSLSIIKNNIVNIYMVATDLNFIRRFLDKDYIKNTIMYTGAAHMCDITFILLKYFDFKITNIFYSNGKIKIKNITDLETNNFEYVNELSKYLYYKNKEDIPYQCSNLFDFPINFS